MWPFLFGEAIFQILILLQVLVDRQLIPKTYFVSLSLPSEFSNQHMSDF